ncbi:FGGY-family carbohydrate kinase [Wenjunlia tyrosinilytica]|uniref:Carbohydrate kinase n=1 Tax=Wenjunlia tyrosinilytica TaxID=1544741 RepID=A0A917ZT78_9ACTN|nr:FGGY family carbohydrate kinase [Wenjunlia tyrosinilytica]GGO93996.1 carbohydrate kinase [Wenjunlia tyrosinilytica]
MSDGVSLPGDVWLGIDLGTQSVRVLAVTASGQVAGQGSQPLTSHRDGPRHEQDPRQWWTAFQAAARHALSGIAPASVKGAAVCATSGTVLLADRTGQPLTPALMYDDARAAEQSRRVNEAGAALWERLGYRTQPSWALPKLMWLLANGPVLPPGARLLHQADCLTRQLTGHDTAADWSHALKTGYDPDHGTWPTEVLEAVGVPLVLLPEVVPPGSVLGTVSGAAAEATGVPAGTAVVAGMTDGCAAQIGAGALEVGAWNSVLGTTLVLKGVTAHRPRDPLGVLYCHRAPEGTWLPGGASSVGAGAVSQAFTGRDLAELDARARAHEPADAVSYPLVSRGERFPFVAPQAEAFTLGRPRDDAERHACLLQGVAFAERLCFDYLDLLGAPTGGPLTLTGGGSRSPYWCQLRADVLGRPVSVPENAEAALGMAILARSRGRDLADTARSMVRLREVLDPRPELTPRLLEAHLRLVTELEARGWLPKALAQHSRERSRP